MKQYPIVLSIAGSDCSGGAGIQADIKTISALGAYAASVITAVTAQNTVGVNAIHTIPAEIVFKQLEAVMEDLHPNVIKIGMIREPDIVRVITNCIRQYTPQYIIYDPVMVSTSGRKLMKDEAIEEIKKELFPLTSLITPNLVEATVLTGKVITTLQEMEQVAKELSETYHTSILLKGGHLQGNEMYDVLYTDNNTYLYKERKIESQNLHGTGCTLSSSIATYLALGHTMNEAVAHAKNYVSEAIKAGKEVITGHGNGPLCHFYNPIKAILTDK